MAATKLVITSVNSGVNPKANVQFVVNVQSQDGTSTPTNPTANTALILTVKTGTGRLLGTTTGTITTAGNNVNITVAYTVAEAGVVLTATRTSGDVLTAGDSASFTVDAGSTFDTQPIYIIGDMVVSYRTSLLGPTGQKGFRAVRVLVAQTSGAVASVAGNITVKDNGATAGRDTLLTIPIVGATQVPKVIDLSGSNAGWRDFIVAGATATKCALQIWYRL